jgi:hypothetical protein
MVLLSPCHNVVIGFIQLDTERYPIPTCTWECKSLFISCVNLIHSNQEKNLFTQYYHEMDETHAHIWRPVNADLAHTMHLKSAILIGDAVLQQL